MRLSTLRHFGLSRGLGTYRGDVHQRRVRDILDAIEAREMLAIIGPFGSGKTELVDMAARECADCEFVWVNNPDKERLRIGHIMQALVEGVSTEDPRRSAQALASQLARVLGEKVVLSSFRQRVTVVIDNAHRLHVSTLMALKDLRELRYKGHRPLFSVILIGQEPLLHRLERHGEVFYRTERLELTETHGWMTLAERVRYLEARFGAAIEATTRRRIAAYARTPLTMDVFVGHRMEEAQAAGFDVVDERVMQLSIEERYEALGTSYAELARAAGVGKTTVSDALNGKPVSEDTRAKIAAGLALLEDQLLQEVV